MNKKPQSFAPPRGMRDFYPDDMRMRNSIFDAWREASLRCGFQQYDACVVESLEWFERKSGEEIAAQIYDFKDKSGRRLALRPEMTPSLARMILAREGELSFPIKWFTIAQCFRYERMTRGRKREHYQWNLDVVGADDLHAEAELLYTAVTAMRILGLPDEAYRIHLSNRALLSELLEARAIERSHHAAVFLALDKRGKQSDEEIAALLAGEGIPETISSRIFELLGLDSTDSVRKILGGESPALTRLEKLFELLDAYGIAGMACFDIGVIRGLAYYSDIVFEAFDTEKRLRAIFGGGRYNGLLDRLGGTARSAAGLGFGDVVIKELLDETLPVSTAEQDRADGFIIGFMSEEQRVAATKLASTIRDGQQNAELMLAPQKPKSFFATAGKSSWRRAIFIGPDDLARGKARIKDLATRKESPVDIPR